MNTEDRTHSQDETVNVTLPRALVEQLIQYDERAANILGVDGFVAAICREWHGEEVSKKTKARADELFFSHDKEATAEQVQEPYIFQVRNHQHESCGTPPHFDNPDGVYLSYYENQFGEQNVFVYDYQTKEAFLYMGDAGWEHPYKVVEGGRVPGLIYGEDEATWLFACWLATHFNETIQMLRDGSTKRKKRK